MTASATQELLEALHFSRRGRLSVILQTEAAECGLACLAMVAGFYGYDIDLPGIRRIASMSLKGATLRRMTQIAGQLGLDSRPLRLVLEKLPQLRTPCILHWDLNHFVVLKRASTKDIIIHDPATGVRRVSLAESSKHFTGVALELWPSSDFKRENAREAISLRAVYCTHLRVTIADTRDCHGDLL